MIPAFLQKTKLHWKQRSCPSMQDNCFFSFSRQFIQSIPDPCTEREYEGFLSVLPGDCIIDRFKPNSERAYYCGLGHNTRDSQGRNKGLCRSAPGFQDMERESTGIFPRTSRSSGLQQLCWSQSVAIVTIRKIRSWQPLQEKLPHRDFINEKMGDGARGYSN